MTRYSAAVVNEALAIRDVAERYGAVFSGGRRYQQARCPMPGHEERTPSFTIYPDTNHFYCYGCGRGGDPLKFIQYMERLENDFPRALEIGAQIGGVAGGMDAATEAQIRHRVEQKRAAQARREEEQRRAKERSAAGRFLAAEELTEDSIAWTYLTERRGIDFSRLGRVPRAIRFTRTFRWNCGDAARADWRDLPAIITAMSRGRRGVVATHVTVLRPDGSDCDREVGQKGRLVLGSARGAAMHLHRGASGEPVTKAARHGRCETLALAEGLEDALSVAMIEPRWRVWAGYSLGNLGLVEVPASVRELVICTEADPSEQARAALRRVLDSQGQAGTKAGFTVRAALPVRGCKDWNAIHERRPK